MNSAVHHIQKAAPRCMPYADDVMLENETRGDLQSKVQMWKNKLDAIDL